MRDNMDDKCSKAVVTTSTHNYCNETSCSRGEKCGSGSRCKLDSGSGSSGGGPSY